VKRFINILICTFSLSYCFCQSNNLVLNPSFESYDTCPYSDAGIGLLFCSNWDEPNFSTSEYYNLCGTDNTVRIPSNFGGYEIPKTGFAYAGLYIYVTSGSIVAREYIQGILKDTLINNHKYIIKYYLSQADSNQFCIDNIGFYFSDTQLHSTSWGRINVVPQYKNTVGNYLNIRNGWQEIIGTFTASGGEKYFSIGNFDLEANTHKQDCYSKGIPTSGGAVYTYIDDVSVIDTSLVDTIQLCVNDSVLLGGSYRHTEGLYIDTIQGLYVRSYLKPSTHPAYHIDVDLPYNGRDSVYVGCFWFNKSNMHTADTTIVLNLPSVTGCDSMVYFHCRNNVGIDEPNASTYNNITIYPNPANQLINLKISIPNIRDENENPAEMQIEIYDAVGNIVNGLCHSDEGGISNTGKEINYKINISELSKGIYFIKVIGKENRIIGNARFIKN
jgi:hypothetical protein